VRIVLDSNILIQDVHLRSEKMALLLSYVERTDSAIVIPDIVLKEVEGHFYRYLQKQLSHLDEILSIAEVCNEARPALVLPDVDEMVRNYMDRLRKRYKLQKSNIPKASPGQLDELVDRAVKRRKPFNANGQQFRDALIWLCVLELGDPTCPRSDVSFISTNTSDFADRGDKLHSELAREAEGANLALDYFPSLDAFLAAHAEPIAYITDELINRIVPKEKLEEQVIREVELSFRVEERLVQKFTSEYRAATGNVDLVTLSLELDDHYVYPGNDPNEFHVIAMYQGKGELWGEVRKWDEEIEWQRRPYESDTDHEWIYPSFYVQVELVLRKEDLISMKVIDVEVG
jgi:predicted nucleic acid-binding protein